MIILKKTNGLLSKYHIKGIYVLIVAYVIFVSFVNSSFMTWGNWMNLLRQVSVYGIMACGITFVMIAGRTELSAGMMISLLCEICCLFVVDGVDNQFLAVMIPIILGAALGLINGVLVGVVRLNSFVATMGTMSVFMGIGLYVYNNSRQLYASQANRFFWHMGNSSVLGVPIPVIICAVTAIIAALVLKKTVFGQQVYAVGGNIVNARFSGINPTRILVIVYVISGTLTGLASVVMTARVMGISSKMGAGFEFICLTAIVLGGVSVKGGKGNISGSLVGVLILGILANSFTIMGVNPYMQYVIQGLILAAAVAVQMFGEKGGKT